MPRTKQGKYVTEASKTFHEGDDFWKQGNYDEARSKYAKAAELYDKKDDPQGEAFVLTRLGELELSLDNFDKAEKALKAAAELVADLVDGSITHGDILIRLSKVYAAAEEYDEAVKTLYQAREILADAGSRDLLGEAYDQEAYIVRNIFEQYGYYDSCFLRNLSHEEYSWKNSRLGLPDGAPGNREIKIEDIAIDARKVRPYDSVWDMYYDEFDDLENES